MYDLANQHTRAIRRAHDLRAMHSATLAEAWNCGDSPDDPGNSLRRTTRGREHLSRLLETASDLAQTAEDYAAAATLYTQALVHPDPLQAQQLYEVAAIAMARADDRARIHG